MQIKSNDLNSIKKTVIINIPLYSKERNKLKRFVFIK